MIDGVIGGVIDGEEVTVVCAASPPNCPAVIGSAWFPSEEGKAMADLAAVGLLDRSPPERSSIPWNASTRPSAARRGTTAGSPTSS
ncbi:hypothetical protein [Streptomyces deccanensis]|uniref:hypothetical protein n=1 Tax=Streptomyces deccanensis TaxID=424188 RepID=UPI001EFA8049|nr:hypothetical protein [Streptomyces deccanensis]ULR48333.1 hypothetical protein L3078_03000 [Streptomyces deccanensis]